MLEGNAVHIQLNLLLWLYKVVGPKQQPCNEHEVMAKLKLCNGTSTPSPSNSSIGMLYWMEREESYV